MAGMFVFPNNAPSKIEIACVKNPDDSICYFLTNADKQKQQVQIFEGGKWYYVEILPYSVCTVVFEK